MSGKNYIRTAVNTVCSIELPLRQFNDTYAGLQTINDHVEVHKKINLDHVHCVVS